MRHSQSLQPSLNPRSTPKISNDEVKTSRKPRKSKSHDEEKTKVSYYTTFQERKCGEPAAVNVGANAGLKNSNVSCYSNAILQCLASCIHFSDFSPSDNHPEFELNHAFASLMTSMVAGGEQIIDPSSFTDVFRPLFRPPVEEEGEVNEDEQEGMYYDFA
jgi:ubiquitin C-terminal hydrolase